MRGSRSSVAGLRIHRDAWGRLVLTDAEGREHVGVEPVRAFPLSDPEHGLSLCDADGREILWIDHLPELPPAVLRELTEELAKREFVPVIRRLLRVSPREPSEWVVQTDRGGTTFLLNSEDDVHRLDERRTLVTDSHGIRYLIVDPEKLDATSRRFLERYL
jgi:hypothetical protein